MKEILAVLLIASLALTSNSALFPVGGRALVIRIDDVQDYGEPSLYARPEKTLLQYHIEHGIPAMLAIIPTRFGEDPQLVDQVKNGVARNIFTVAMHGWRHISLANLSRSAQISELQYGKNKLETILGTNVLGFVPPYNEFNQDTIYAVRTNGLTLMSSSVYVGDVPRQEDGIAFLPQTVTTAAVAQNDTWDLVPFESVIQEIKDSWDLYGVAVIVLHPRQLVGPNNEDRWMSYVNIIEWIVANQGNIIRFEPPTPKRNIDPFLISVGIFSGLTSTLLIALNVSTGRSNRKAKRSSAQAVKAPHSPHHTHLNLDLRAGKDAKKDEAAIPKADSESGVKDVAFVSEVEATDSSIMHTMLRKDSARGQSSKELNPASVLQGQFSGAPLLPVVSCRRCGRSIARDDKYCDECGQPAS